MEKFNAVEKKLASKTALEDNMKRAVQEANAEISRNNVALAEQEKVLKEKMEYISILENRGHRNKIATEKIVSDLKGTILEQDQRIHAWEEKCLTQANDSSVEVERFRSEKFDISIKLQVRNQGHA